ncbi:putative 1-aminocyclopropane-1-carboxylate deaminase [Teratosphaeria destructans]|uniref:1-aminocyclopropane-1-carboxylate deaminase n=1 Tax=Teratosphaeria destructans TaxID=418781 RepID=A0A9W7W6D1_9PEZI|nr:putative 1-aminocyclopropane-1-carboxylate deaminase [Teratosphaeria destructans]
MSQDPLPPYLQKLQSIPKHPLLFGPSPLQRLPRLTEALVGDSSSSNNLQIWAKRDDCNR